MYVVTFYSFKGGVGRTMSLVNVAFDLVRSGHSVLIVDFDLEAPGVHTFEALRPPLPCKGIVELVTEYTQSGVSPDIEDFTYEATGLDDKGKLWVMPAGKGGPDYRRQLSEINWPKLYADNEGFLLFEDIKAQWKCHFKPDYVLIDSRTGHSDIEGICTRQLPDAVVLHFYPNEQNLNGLQQVARDIRAESDIANDTERKICLHFVMSNVPDLDDEDGILQSRVEKAHAALGFEELIRIHYYPSLALMDQMIFTKDRTNSRLAKEYRNLKDNIADQNDEDVEGVLRFLRRVEAGVAKRHSLNASKIDVRLQSIETMQANNREAMFLLGLIRKREGNLAEAVIMLSRSIELGFEPKQALLERATVYAMQRNLAESQNDLQKLFQYRDLDTMELYRAVQLLRRGDPDVVSLVLASPAYKSLDLGNRMFVARSLLGRGAEVLVTGDFRKLVNEKDFRSPSFRADRNELVLAAIGNGHLDLAMAAFGDIRPDPAQLAIEDAFNYAMAEWGLTKVLPVDMFGRVVDLETVSGRTRAANFQQCMAIANWAVGRQEEAKKRLEDAIRKSNEIATREFSCWRYKPVNKEEFLADCAAISKMFKLGDALPPFA
ncbi:KGGVGR-motif variant AAA ATPase [Anatilimnocola floriformis]|uniref:KGGVGR-motif variant AAA ATPase n=1 Tax=Anatilimnocola floriformis TaxID=2948575 RepID=UPI0020C3BA7D|nr:AAA family ATPase [Anatilimnocola floriformis]